MRLVWMWTVAAGLAAAQTGGVSWNLSLKRAVELAISPEGSARIQIAGEALKQAQARSSEARSALLPDVESSFTDQSRTENLRALGLSSSAFAIPIAGFQIPEFVGPFTTVDARVTGNQAVFDFSSTRRFQAAKVAVSAARQATAAQSALAPAIVVLASTADA